MTAEHGALPDALSDEPATAEERELLDRAGVNLDSQSARGCEWQMLSALRAGHEAGRASVLDAPVRVYRGGDLEPDHSVWLLDKAGDIESYKPNPSHPGGGPFWRAYLGEWGPLVEVRADYAAALDADEKRRAAS
jgi:hypothetical protein